jgi:DNA-binding IclR family transcriptional regulator
MVPTEPGGHRGTTRTLVRGLMLLELIGAARDGGTVSELAHETGLDKGTVSRLLATIRDAGWAHQSPEDRRYRLAGKALALSHDYTNRVDLRALAVPRMAALRDEWNETVHLGAMEGDEVVYVERLEPNVPVRVVSVVGQRMPIACTAMGRAFLAGLPQDEMERRVADLPLDKRTAKTITDPGLLLKDIRLCRRRGYSVDLQENNADVICVGAAITDVTGRPIAAISVSGPAHRMRAPAHRIGKSCSVAASSISGALGSPETGRRGR